MIVVDASVLANVVGDDGQDGELARAALRSAVDIAAPDVVDVQAVAVLRRRWLAGGLTERRFAASIDDLEAIGLDRYPTLPLMRRAQGERRTAPHEGPSIQRSCTVIQWRAMNEPHVMTVSRNGQVSIPAEARARWNTRRVVVVDLGDRVVMRPLRDEPVGDLQGKYRRRGPSTERARKQARDDDAHRARSR